MNMDPKELEAILNKPKTPIKGLNMRDRLGLDPIGFAKKSTVDGTRRVEADYSKATADAIGAYGAKHLPRFKYNNSGQSKGKLWVSAYTNRGNYDTKTTLRTDISTLDPKILALRRMLYKIHITDGQLFRFMDADRSNTISFGEFRNGLSLALSNKRVPVPSGRDLRTLFGSFDLDHGNSISYEEMLRALGGGHVRNTGADGVKAPWRDTTTFGTTQRTGVPEALYSGNAGKFEMASRLPTPLEDLRGRGVLDRRYEADRELLYTRERHLKHQMRALGSGALTAR